MGDVRAAEEAFLASTVREGHPVGAVDDVELPAAPGPVTQDAARRTQALIEAELGATPASG
jgi:branched-chain amino acid aminotransferase